LEVIRSAQANPLQLFRLVGQERVAEDLEQARFALPTSVAERIHWRTDSDVGETDLFKHLLPACARQATGNSIGPEIDVSERPCRNHLAGCDIRELQPSTQFQYPHDLGEYLPFVGAKVDDAIADDDIGPTIVYR